MRAFWPVGSAAWHHAPVESETIADAARCLHDGGLVAFPTETVYGLGADAANADAVRRLYAVKGRPTDHPSIVHLAATEDVEEGWVAAWPESARRLTAALWPGPLTVIAQAGPRAAREVLGGTDSIALRVPDHALARALIRASGSGIAAPSANRFGRVSPTTADHVRSDLGDDVDVVLDGGPCPVGVESTIVDCRSDPPRLVRPGGVAPERLEAILGAPLGDGPSTVRAPGTLASHYAPRARVIVADPGSIDPPRSSQRIAYLAPTRSEAAPPWAEVVLDAGPDAESYARRLYALLREADRAGADTVVAVPPPAVGIGVAVRDRLERASRGTSDADERT